MAKVIGPLLATNSVIKNRGQLINVRFCVLERLDKKLSEIMRIELKGWRSDQNLVYELDNVKCFKCKYLGYVPLTCLGELKKKWLEEEEGLISALKALEEKNEIGEEDIIEPQESRLKKPHEVQGSKGEEENVNWEEEDTLLEEGKEMEQAKGAKEGSHGVEESRAGSQVNCESQDMIQPEEGLPISRKQEGSINVDRM